MNWERYRRLGRIRAVRHRAAVERAIADVESVLASHGVERAPILAEAEAVEASAPARFRAEGEGMAEALPVSRDELRVTRSDAGGTGGRRRAVSRR